ncbi:hypothetical protein [Vibrio sp. CAU 1672]|uniref:hypothetical protein n=1 Tax=Vibrio sp. CAU 1672 TaxID=3032594 RepID=UPI0023DB7FE0|nr:hypothetical protein [Vibrio sp. CAU 1672]MDF2152284.1 hypothetical protein [Vibrio sp. CAU 1672]
MARSTNDVYDVFCYTVATMLNEITETNKFRDTDIGFFPERECHYEFDVDLQREPGLAQCLDNSELSRILDEMAQAATNRHTHLMKHPEKTNSKIMRH